MAETFIYDGDKRVAAIKNKKGGSVGTSSGTFVLSSGVLEGHNITGFDKTANHPVHSHVGPEHPELVVGEVIFFYGERESIGSRIASFVSSLIPPESQPVASDSSSEVPLY